MLDPLKAHSAYFEDSTRLQQHFQRFQAINVVSKMCITEYFCIRTVSPKIYYLLNIDNNAHKNIFNESEQDKY